MQGSIDSIEVHSNALSGNPLGDAVTRKTYVYLPPGYDESKERFPTVYFLHGFTGSGAGWLNVSPFSPNAIDRLDGLIGRGAISPVIGVFVDGWTALGGSQWVNSGAIGRYRDYVVQDVVPTVDERLRTVRHAGGRAVIGKSSGGYGALVMARHQPDVFGHIACHSGDAYFEYCYLPDFPKAAGVLLAKGGLEAWFGDFNRRARETKVKGDDHPVLNTVAMAAAYSPAPAAPMGIDLPFDLPTGRIRDDVWARWKSHDPVRFVAEEVATFRRLQTVFVDCGSRDEFHLRWGARMVVEALVAGKVAVTHEEFEDGHMGITYRYDRSLLHLVPRMARS